MPCQKAKKEIALERDHVCTGCGTPKHIIHSHYIAVSKRKDLECVKENITYHCLSIGKEGCGDKWESCNEEKMKQLKDFKTGMAIVKKYDESHWNWLNMRFQEQRLKNLKK